MTAQQEIAPLAAGQMLYAEAGVTTAQEGATHFPQIQTIKRASDSGANIIDVVAYPFITDADKSWRSIHWKDGPSMRTASRSVVSRSPSTDHRRAALPSFTTPYLTGGPGGEKNWKGEPTFPQDLANKMFKKVYDMNVPLLRPLQWRCRHRRFPESLRIRPCRRLQQALERDHHPHPVHAQGSDPQVRAVQDPPFPLHPAHLLLRRGPHQKPRQGAGDYISPMRDAIDAGLHPTNHTDFVVAPLDQMMMLCSAVNRISRGGHKLVPTNVSLPTRASSA